MVCVARPGRRAWGKVFHPTSGLGGGAQAKQECVGRAQGPAGKPEGWRLRLGLLSRTEPSTGLPGWQFALAKMPKMSVPPDTVTESLTSRCMHASSPVKRERRLAACQLCCSVPACTAASRPALRRPGRFELTELYRPML